MVFLDLNPGETLRVDLETLPFPASPKTQRLTEISLVTIKSGKLCAGSGREWRDFQHPPTLLRKCAWANYFPFPRKLICFLLWISSRKQHQKGSKGHETSEQRTAGCGFWAWISVWRQMPARAGWGIWNTPLEWFCIVWFPNAGNTTQQKLPGRPLHADVSQLSHLNSCR